MTDPTAPSQPSLPAQPVGGKVTFEAGGRLFDVAFPDTGNTRELISKIVTGHEYPTVRLEGHVVRNIVDIGAHVGAAALMFHAVFPDANVYCYEPAPVNRAYLVRNTSACPKILAMPYGLLDRDGEAPLFAGVEQSMQSSFHASRETGRHSDTVPIRRASTDFAAQGLKPGDVTLLKIDTEGCEVPILSDLKAAGYLHGTDFLYLEYHSEADRLRLDALLADHFVLGYARSSCPHRGTNLYLSHALVQRYPILDAKRVETTSIARQG
jgi:FkbM family methyltransferase